MLGPFRYLIILAGILYLLYQVRKPGRIVGRLFARLMNESHSRLTDWALSHVNIEKHFTVLDIGCGGGATVRKLAMMAATVQGIDYAPGSVATSQNFNADLIKTGRVRIQQATVSHLPFAEATFDLATAIETQYYWPDLVNDMREILRVLKPAGVLMIAAETYKGGRTDKWQRPLMKLLGAAHLDPAAHRELFASAGYTEIQLFEEKSKGWICITGKKPAT